MSNNEHDKNMYSTPSPKQDASFTHVANNIAYEKDVEYMKQLYPAALKYIQAEVDEQCDKLEYAGSVMFDEYPDKNHLRMIVDTILQKIKSGQKNEVISSSNQNINSVESASIENRTSQTADNKAFDSEETSTDHQRLFCFGPNCSGPGPWRPGPGPWRPWPGRPPRPWRPGPPPGPWNTGPWNPGPRRKPYGCGPYCPYASQPCGEGKYCPPEPYPDLKEDGSPDWLRHLVENMLSNEMNYRRNRYRAKNL